MEKLPRVAVDAIIADGKKILLIKRKDERGWALPGGLLEYGETTENAIVREVREETGLDVKALRLFGVYSEPERDSRWHTVSVVYVCKVRGGQLNAGDDATEAEWRALEKTSELAFDHKRIIADFFSGRSHLAEADGLGRQVLP